MANSKTPVVFLCGYCPDGALRGEAAGGDHEESVDDNIKVEGGELVARVVVVPHADLHGRDDGRVEKEEAAADHLACTSGCSGR